MIRRLAGAWALASFVAAAGAAPTVFREHVVTDPGMNDHPALRLLVPEGWTTEGGMSRPSQNLYSMPTMLDLKVVAPDGRAFRQYPSWNFEFNHNQPQPLFSATLNGYAYYPVPASPGAWLAEMMRNHPAPGVSEARVVAEEMEPAGTQELRQKWAWLAQLARELSMTGASMGMQTVFDTQLTKVTLRYKEDGKDLEETIHVKWMATTNLMQGRPYQGTWAITAMSGLRGPVGTAYQDDPELLAIVRSARLDPKWQAEMQKYFAKLAEIRARGQAQRNKQSWVAHQKRMKTMQETSDIIHQGWQNRQAARDAGQSRFIDSIHGVTNYQQPGGSSVKLPSFYQNVYTNGDGRYLLHNDALYDPNTDPALNAQDWQRLQAAGN